MTTNEPGEVAPESQDALPADEGDPDLATLVRIANTGGMSLGVTLLVGGATVSGLLVGSAEFFDGLAAYMEARGGDGGAVLAKLYRQQATDFREAIGTDFEKAFSAPYVATFIHLQDARVFAPGGRYLPTDEGLFWRGRLDSIDGWSIGNLGTT